MEIENVITPRIGPATRGIRQHRRSMTLQIVRRALAVLISAIVMLAITAGGIWYWYNHRPAPTPIIDQPLFQGITYTREVRSDPRPLVIHVLRVDLTAPGIAFLVTPGDPVDGYQLRARKTSQFLDEYDLQAAINGSFFEPWWSNGPWDYYPHVGDPVNSKGFTSSLGDIYSPEQGYYQALYISEDNRLRFDRPIYGIYNALPTNAILIEDGELPDFPDERSFYTQQHPRTAAGIDATGETLILVVVDGRQPNYSEGVTIPELAALMQEFGCVVAHNLDGGGSSTMVIESANGSPDVLNSTIDNLIPGRERPVATHLGIWAKPLGE